MFETKAWNVVTEVSLDPAGLAARPRYDQLMALGWKILLPITLVNLLATGAIALLRVEA